MEPEYQACLSAVHCRPGPSNDGGQLKKTSCNSPCIDRTFLGLKVNGLRANLMFQWRVQYVCQRKQNSPFPRCLSGFAVLNRSQSQTLIMEKKTVCLISQYLIGHEVKHSSLQEEKITHLKYKIPFLETQIVPHLLYWAWQGCILFHAIFHNPDKIDSSTMCQLLFVNLVRFGC